MRRPVDYILTLLAILSSGQTLAQNMRGVERADIAAVLKSDANYETGAIAVGQLTGLPLSPADLALIDRLVDAARQMAGPHPTDAYKLAAVRKAIYEPGPWNY